MHKFNSTLPILLAFACHPCLAASSIIDSWNALEREQKLLYTNVGGALAITAWGLVHWDYFERSPHADSEGWFGADTKFGGADKLGHVYTGYVTGRALSHLYEGWDYDPQQAKALGALSSFGLFGLMELGDSFSSSYGFSYEDFLMNGVGSYAGYLLDTHPDMARKFDLRIEYNPRDGKADLTTDYDNSRYLVALKLDGFGSLQNSFLRHFEFHAGYYTRGFDTVGVERQRTPYFGISLNFSRLARRYSLRRTATFLQYYQLPGATLRMEH